MSRDDTVTVEGLRVMHVAPKSMLVDKSGREAWLPLSQIEETDLKAKGDEGYARIPRWLADAEELDYDEE